MNWETVNLSDKYHYILKMCYGNGQYVGFAYKGYTTGNGHSYVFVTSKDGENFEEHETENVTGMNYLEYANGVYLFTGKDSEGNLCMGRSTDGYTWDIIPLPENMTIQLRIANDKFIILGTDFNNLFISTDGINFEHKTINATIFHIAYGNGVYIGVHNHNTQVYRSYDLENWEEVCVLNMSSNCICFGDGKFMLGCSNTAGVNPLYISEDDGETWTKVNFDTSGSSVLKIDYRYGTLILHSSAIYTSTDLESFEKYVPEFSSLWDLCCGNRSFIATFTNGLIKATLPSQGSSTAYIGQDNEYKQSNVYIGQDNEYKQCEVYVGIDGEYKLCG